MPIMWAAPSPIFDEGIKFRLSNVTKLDMELSAVSRELDVRVGAVQGPAFIFRF